MNNQITKNKVMKVPFVDPIAANDITLKLVFIVFKHSPVSQFHTFIVESVEPLTNILLPSSYFNKSTEKLIRFV
jgi:hypothetical protein